MALPKLFIGSSHTNLRVAQVLGNNLKDVADVTVWNEGVFGMNYGYLETLVNELEKHDFAAFILAPDDVTTSKDQTRLAPRDNVLFESGLFMGVLGRERVFLVYDESKDIKIPSDLAGVTLAKYDGAQISGSQAASAVREAALAIGDRIKLSRFPHLLGEWKSEYPMPYQDGCPMVTEVISIRTGGDCVYFVTKTNSEDDFYTSWGRVVVDDRQILGKWKSREESNNMAGAFMLTVSPRGDYMYGYFTSPDVGGATVYATWVLAKTDADEAKIEKRLASARKRLKQATVLGPTQESATV
jgi:hypothetical protein